MSENPFDYVDSILSAKKPNLLRGDEVDDGKIRSYPKRVVNKALSYNPATILHAAAINLYPDLDNRATYEFLLNSIRPGKKAFVKWSKKEDDEIIDCIAEVYKCNRQIAKQYRKLMSDDQVQEVMKTMYKGGVGKPRK